MKQLIREWLNAAEDDLIAIENLLSNPILTNIDRLYIDSRYPGDLGLMPNGKPSLEEAEKYFQEALKINKQAETFLLSHPLA